MTAEAVVTDVEDRRIVFTVTARDEIQEIGCGIHERVLVDLRRLTQRLDDKRNQRDGTPEGQQPRDLRNKEPRRQRRTSALDRVYDGNGSRAPLGVQRKRTFRPALTSSPPAMSAVRRNQRGPRLANGLASATGPSVAIDRWA